MTLQQPVKVFLSYAHKDEANARWCSEFLEHLSALGEKWDHAIDLWFDGRITAGENWREQIGNYLDGVELFLFLHSASFTYSTECQREYEYAEQREPAGVRLVMVRLRPALVPEKLTKRQWTPRGNPPITCCPDKDSVFESVANDIKAVVHAIISARSSNFSQGTTS